MLQLPPADYSTLVTSMQGVANLVTSCNGDMKTVLITAGSIYVFSAVKRLILKAMKNKKPKGLTAESFPELALKNTTVFDLITQMRLKMGADRVVVVQYHNGTKNLKNLDFLRMTCSHESITPGLRAKQLFINGLPVSAYNYLTLATCDKESRQLVDISVLKDIDTYTYELFVDDGAESVLISPLKDEHNLTFGYVLIEFATPTPKVSTNEFLTYADTYVMRIATLINSIEEAKITNKEDLKDDHS